jgi:hypothetical protein
MDNVKQQETASVQLFTFNAWHKQTADNFLASDITSQYVY